MTHWINEMIDSRPWYIKFCNKIRGWFGSTHMFWIKIDDVASLADAIISKRIKFLLHDAIKTNAWVHVAAILKRFGKDRLYINGKEVNY